MKPSLTRHVPGISVLFVLLTTSLLAQQPVSPRNRYERLLCVVPTATYFFHFPSIQIAQWLQLSPSAITRILRRAQPRLMTDQSQLERIKGLLQAG